MLNRVVPLKNSYQEVQEANVKEELYVGCIARGDIQQDLGDPNHLLLNGARLSDRLHQQSCCLADPVPERQLSIAHVARLLILYQCVSQGLLARFAHVKERLENVPLDVRFANVKELYHHSHDHPLSVPTLGKVDGNEFHRDVSEQ